MRRVQSTAFIVVTLVAVACGGSEFTSESADGGANPVDAGPDDVTVGRQVRCGQSVCGAGGQSGSCCVSNSSTCSLDCACSDALLYCTDSGQCPGYAPICCLHQTTSAGFCPVGRVLAECYFTAAECDNARGRELCDVSSPGCKAGSCSANASCVGLPSNQGYGVCGGC
jgi:hypothetical protein